AQVFGNEHRNDSLVLKREHPNARANALFAFQKELRLGITEYISRKLREREEAELLIRAELQKDAESEASQQMESQIKLRV
ncbi:MAG: hypothetical protein ACREBW_08080, partial [Candidatus Micrarchaeaceae archaeon]